MRAAAAAGLAYARDVRFGPRGRERRGEGGKAGLGWARKRGRAKKGRKKRKERLSFYFKRI